MRLNPDCIRALLMYFEEKTDDSITICSFDEIAETIHFDAKEISYHVNQCNFHGFLINYKPYNTGDSFMINDISPSAHAFLANIRQDTTWNGIKDVAKKVGSVSLDALVQISSNVITELIKAQFLLK
ncbi:MAG: DUF2513 domain-containing protein [Lachnospiraceae bacterium]|nr:DUF2513 domain-containing protein [Lachnospiraceae bacterium]